MHPTIQALKNALSYAKFQDDEIESATHALVIELGNDLDQNDENAQYEHGSKVERAQTALEVAMNDFDASRESTSALIEDAKDEVVTEE
jgi:hypothetical protein